MTLTSGSSSWPLAAPTLKAKPDGERLGPLDVVLDVQVAGLGVLVGADAVGARELLARLTRHDRHAVLGSVAGPRAAGRTIPARSGRPRSSPPGPSSGGTAFPCRPDRRSGTRGSAGRAWAGSGSASGSLSLSVTSSISMRSVHFVPVVRGLDRAADIDHDHRPPGVAVGLPADPRAAVERVEIQRPAQLRGHLRLVATARELLTWSQALPRSAVRRRRQLRRDCSHAAA